MAKPDKKLTVEIPRPGADQPIWSRVGIIGFAGFVIGIAWPKLAGVKVGPAVPGDLRAQIEATAGPSASAAPPAPSALASAPLPAPVASASATAEPAADNRELVVVAGGKIVKCFDKKDKKIDDCEKLQFDPIAVKKLEELSKCPSALGLSGKMTIGFEINFDKKEVQVTKAKKGGAGSLPSSTVNGILQCAAKEFANIALDEVPHKFKHYTVSYGLTFYPPGKHPEGEAQAGGGDEDGSAGSTTNESEASGTATITVDSAVLRKEPKSKEKAGRLVRGAKVKIVGKQNDWYKVEADGKTGWLYRSALGM
ncbi:MAG: SH3 domain-containing protein [Byssovorax sp.]